ncbi:hypothetical protein DPMN_129434 [Dreissena polymorpha]|uniref:Uncharacterized protein n=1 Tax=Dreissena polymorpha TaxID=45954 RepID=A0A9D4H163_DREPO|nr:hypothetical protein DPMN_129434 [Dreissena polymorpha]
MPQTIGGREYKMAPLVIIQKDEDTRLNDIEEKYMLTTTPNKGKQNKRRERKSKRKTVTLDFFRSLF